MNIAKCRSCKADIVWAKTKNEKFIPLDVASVNEATFDGNYDAEAGHRTHFRTCPQGGEHRKPRT